MDIINFFKVNIILTIFIVVSLLTFLIRIPYFLRIKNFTYSYSANTKYNSLDHNYDFSVILVKNGYRCYIEKTPSFRGQNTSRYTPHYWIEKGTNRHYICWTGNIKYPEQAKTLCRNWANATQQFIDTGRPAPGFERK